MTQTEVPVGRNQSDPGNWHHLFAPGIAALRTLWKPFVLIQLCGLAVVVAYFNSEKTRYFCDQLAAIKLRGGWPFAAVVMGCAAGFSPEVFKLITGVDRSFTRDRAKYIAFNFAFFCMIGVLCDTFYRALAVTLGDRPNFVTVATKVLIDQLVLSPFITLPLLALAFTWRDSNFSIRTTASRLGMRWVRDRVGTLLVICWAYWFPMTILMYSLPASLTFIFGAIASSASAMVLTSVAARKHE